jgi:Family of unknown function (DUF6247)
MSAQPHDVVPGVMPEPAKSLRAIRTALVVRQDREAFDAGLKAVLDEVRVNLDLGVLNDFVHRWWISACDSVRDPDGRRRMHARADQVLVGEPTSPGTPWRQILAERESGR